MLINLVGWTRIEELSSVIHEEKKLSATLQTNLEKQETENETFKQVFMVAALSFVYTIPICIIMVFC